MNTRVGPVRALFQNLALAGAESLGFPLRQVMQRAAGAPGYARVQIADALPRSSANAIPYGVAYEISPDVYACVSLIAQTIAGLELQLWSGEGRQAKRIERKPGNAMDLWRRPSKTGLSTDFENIESFVSNALVYGTGYLLKERQRKAGGTDESIPQELVPLCAAFVTPIPGPGRSIDRYRYYKNGQELFYSARDVVRIPFWSTDDGLEGLSPLSAARLKTGAQYNSNLFIHELWRTGGGMPIVFSSKTPLGEEQEKAFLARLEQRFRNVRKWFMPQFYPSELKADHTQATLADMQFVELAKLTTTDIAKLFRTPADLIGVDKSGALTQASLEAAMLFFVEFGVRPLLTRIERALDERLWRDFTVAESSDYLHCKFDTSSILAVKAAWLKLAEGVVKVTGRPVLKGNEGREKLDEEPIQDDPSMDEVAKSGGGTASDTPDEGDPNAPAEPKGSSSSTSKRPRRPERAEAGQRARPVRPFTRRSLKDAAHDQTDRAESRGTVLWSGFLSAQEDRCMRAILAAPLAARFVDADIEAVVQLISDDDEREELAGFLQRLLEATGQSNLDALTPRQVTQAAAFDMQALTVQRWIRAHIERAIDLPNETTKEMLRNAIIRGVREGDTLSAISNRAAEMFEARRGNLRTIARTEVLPALNFAALESFSQSGRVHASEWSTAADELVRGNKPADLFDHRAMNGVVVPLGELFKVPMRGHGFEEIRHPGDPIGSASNIINCRCRVVPVLEGQRVIPYSGVAWRPSPNGHRHLQEAR